MTGWQPCRPVGDRLGWDGPTTWRGIPMLKHPLDLVALAEVLQTVRPRLVIETGTAAGGSALFMADVLTAAGVRRPKVVTIDTEPGLPRPPDPRISYLRMNSTEWGGPRMIRRPVLVVLDSDHTTAHVLRELELFAPLVDIGSYVIVEDTWMRRSADTDTLPPGDGGPGLAVRMWLERHPEFEADPWPERFGTMNPGGWLRRG